jgi:hypothetical protein
LDTKFYGSVYYVLGPGVAYWLRHCATIWKVSGSIPSGVTGDFFFVATDGTMCPEVDSASKNEYQDTQRGTDGRCVRLPKVKKIGGLNLPDPQGACTGL